MSSLISLGHYLPDHRVTNEDLSKLMDTSDEWITTRTGIKERRWIREGAREFTGMRNFEMAQRASQRALASCGVHSSEIDAVIYATISPDFDLPGSGVLLRDALGLVETIPVVEVRNQCSGFLFGLMVADAYVESGEFRSVLVVGSEIQSSGLDLSDEGRAMAVLFGDGCGVALVGPHGVRGHRILGIELHNDGRYGDMLGVRYPSFARPIPVEKGDFESAGSGVFPHMDGRAVFRAASERMPEVIRSLCKRCGVELAQLSAVIPHQANQRIIDMVAQQLGGSIRVFSNISRYGNTTAASIPLALSEADEQQFLSPGGLVALVSFGAGFAWGAALLEW